MFVVGLTGGIGSGKSTVAALLAEQGARVVDADLLGREALQPGRPAWHSVVDQFGDEVLAHHSMQIDRKRLAEIVFADREKLAALNDIVARMRAQASPEEQEAKADLVVRNNGNIEELTREAERLWLELSAMASGDH